jgi:hypothetical protein
MKRRVISLCWLLLSTIIVAQTVQKSAPTDQDLTAEQKTKVVRLANLEKNFGKSMNSPGAELFAKEIGRSRGTDRTIVKYELRATGMPPDKTYTLLQVQINGSLVKTLAGVTLDAEGRAICAGRKDTCHGGSPNSPIDLGLFAGWAEPKRLALVSDDGTAKAFVEVIPFPNSTVDKGCSLESVLGTAKGEVTYVRGHGFAPGEELTMNSESYGEKNNGVAKAEADGSYFAVALPNVLGKLSGTTVWEVKGKTCDPKLTFTWGTYKIE